MQKKLNFEVIFCVDSANKLSQIVNAYWLWVNTEDFKIGTSQNSTSAVNPMAINCHGQVTKQL